MENKKNKQYDLGEYKKVIEDLEQLCITISKIEEHISEEYNAKDNGNIPKNYQKCYLIEHKDFENLKEKILYKIFKKNIEEYKEKMVTEIICLETGDNKEKIEKLKNTIVNSVKELIGLLNENHEYILINSEIGKDILANNNEKEYFYKLESTELILYINGDKLCFHHSNNNAINKNTLKGSLINNDNEQKDTNGGNNINEIYENLNNDGNEDDFEKKNDLMNLVDWLEKYFLTEQKFKVLINEKKKENDNNKMNGYLINKKMYNDWKKKLNYDSIGTVLSAYLIGDKKGLTKEDKKEIIKILMNEEIEKKKIDSLHFDSIQELRNFNRLNDLVLINKELFYLINEKEEKNNEIEFIFTSNKSTITLIIKNEKFEFFNFENIIYSYINFNLFLLIKVFIVQKDIFINKKTYSVYIFKKGFFEKYKEIFEYDKFQSFLKKNNLIDKGDGKQINDFIEKIPDSYINSIKEKINNTSNIFDFKQCNIVTEEIKMNENILFNYIKDFDNLILEVKPSINFFKLNAFPKESNSATKVIKIRNIKDKIIFIFRIQESNKIFCQIGKIIKLENSFSFNANYLILIKENLTKKKDITLLDDYLKEEKDIDNFYQKIYGNNSEPFFELNFSEKIFLYVLNCSKINDLKQINLLNDHNNNNDQINNNINKDNNTNSNHYNQNPPNINNNQNFHNQQQNQNVNSTQNLENNDKSNPFYKYDPQKVDNYPHNDNIPSLNQNQQLQNNNQMPNNNNGYQIINEQNNFQNNSINGPNSLNNQVQNNDNVNNKTIIMINQNNNLNNIMNSMNNYVETYGNGNNNNYNNEFNKNMNSNQNFQDGINNINNSNNVNFINQNHNFQSNNVDNYNNINNNNINNFPQNQNYYDENKIKNYLYFIVNFLKSDLFIKTKMNKNNTDNWKHIHTLYLINKQWVNTFFSLFNTTNELNHINTAVLSIINSEVNCIVENIFQILSDNAKQYFTNLDFNFFQGKLNDNNLITIEEQYINLYSTKLRLYSNFYFLDEMFYNYLKSSINFDMNSLSMKSDSILINQKIFAFTNDNNVYITKFGNDLHSLYTKKIILYQNNDTKKEIINLVQSNYNNYFKYVLLAGDIIPNHLNIEIVELKYNDSIKNNITINKLKAYIQLEIYKNKLIEDTNDTNQKYENKEEEVVLIKKDFLNKIGFGFIIKILSKYIQGLDKKYFTNQQIDNIIMNLSFDDIQLFKQEIAKYNYNNISVDDILPKPETITSFNNKSVSVLNDLLVFKKDVIKMFINEGDIDTQHMKKIISGNGINIIKINNHGEKTLLLGNIINHENSFKLLYIFNYIDEYNLGKALKKIYKDYLGYINDYLTFDNDEYAVSPIFDREERIIGYGYKYSDNLLSNSLYDYYLCDNLKNVIQLFNYYIFLNNKVNNTNTSHHNNVKLSPYDYYLVSKKWVQ